MTTQTSSPLRQRMIEDMQARKLGSHSQRNHVQACKRFAAFLKRSPETASADDVRLFQLHLVEQGVSICNRNRIMVGVKFLLRVTLRRPDLANEIYHIREPQKIPLVLSAVETKRLLAMAKDARSHALLSLCYGCGLRAGEVVRLKVGDIDSAQGIIRVVQGKGRKDRNVMLPADVLDVLPLWKETAAAVKAWLKVRPASGAPELFLNARTQAMTRSGFEYILVKHVATAACKTPSIASKVVSPHVLRHTCAMHTLQATRDVRKVSLWLGHASLQSTEVYLRADPTEKLEALAAMAPPMLKPGHFRAPDKLLAMLSTAGRKPNYPRTGS